MGKYYKEADGSFYLLEGSRLYILEINDKFYYLDFVATTPECYILKAGLEECTPLDIELRGLREKEVL